MSKIFLHGVRMRAVQNDKASVVSAETELTFEQVGDVVSARYRGGKVIDGYLIGHLSGHSLAFHYVQADVDGNVDAGASDCIVERQPSGSLQLTERYRWFTRPQTGVNVFEEVRS